MHIKATTPPTLGLNAFSYCNSNLQIFVPIASLEAYKKADYWKNLNIGTEITAIDLGLSVKWASKILAISCRDTVVCWTDLMAGFMHCHWRG